MAGLALWQKDLLCSLGRGTVFHVSMLGLVVHIGLSHRDDLPVRRAAAHFKQKYFGAAANKQHQPFPLLCCCDGEVEDEGEGSAESKKQQQQQQQQDKEDEEDWRSRGQSESTRSMSMASNASSVMEDLQLFVTGLEAEERFLLQNSQLGAYKGSLSSRVLFGDRWGGGAATAGNSDATTERLRSSDGAGTASSHRVRFNSVGLESSSHDFRRSVSFDESAAIQASERRKNGPMLASESPLTKNTTTTRMMAATTTTTGETQESEVVIEMGAIYQTERSEN
jgi:hypothetical protein